MTSPRLAALTIVCAAACAVSACSKDPEPAPRAPGATAPGTQPAATLPPKPAGPLQSELGTRMARLEVIPTGRFNVTILAKNRADLDAIEATELDCTVMCDGKTESLKLKAKPSEAEQKDGKSSTFVGFSTALVSGKETTVVATLPVGEPKNATFKVPANYRTY